MMMTNHKQNDWTLDTNVLIVANGVTASRQTQTGSQAVRGLLKCITRRGIWNWSSGVAQEYQVRGAINLQSIGPPPTPVPVSGPRNATWVDHWMASIENKQCMRVFSSKEIQKLTGSEKEKLRQKGFRDTGDYPFLELARSSKSKRLVTQEADYNPRTIPGIKRILGVYCLDYQVGLAKCEK